MLITKKYSNPQRFANNRSKAIHYGTYCKEERVVINGVIFYCLVVFPH